MDKVEASISVAGLTGVDKLLAFLIVTELQNVIKEVEVSLQRDPVIKEVVKTMSSQLTPQTHIISQPQRLYVALMQKSSKLCAALLDRILRIGQMQILRMHAAHRLNASCRFDSKYLAAALETMNKALLADVKGHYSDPTKPYPDEEGVLTSELNTFLEWCGMTQPLDKIYITTKPNNSMPHILLLTIIAQISKIHYAKNLGGLVSIRGTEGVDGNPLVVGLVTLLRQYHQDHTQNFLQLLAQYITSHASHVAASGGKSTELPHESVTGLAVLQDVAKKMAIPTKTLATHLPQHLLAAHSG